MVEADVSPESLDEKLLKHFRRHLVPMRFTLVKGIEKKNFVISTFALSIRGYWLLATAGHTIRDIEKLINGGFEILTCQLIDNVGLDSRFHHTIPFDFSGSDAVYPYDDDQYDYGLIFLTENCRALLEANGVVALDETTWEEEPDRVEAYFMVGVSHELTEIFPAASTVTVAMHGVEKLDTKPFGFGDTDAPRFYGKIQLSKPITTIKGLSGGPIFSVCQTDSEYKYWLHAIQSGWVSTTQEIAACLMPPFARLIADILEGRDRPRGSNDADV